ncbi:MAG: hypothetical protein JSV55_01320, partial [Deltaproteobacteria bacterium]
QGCGFPHTQVAKRTAPSRQSLKKRFHGLATQENARSKMASLSLRTAQLGVKAIIDSIIVIEPSIVFGPISA